MKQTQQKLETLQERLHKIRQKLRALPQKREELKTVFNELRAGWPEQLARWALNDITEAELDEARRELTIASRNLKELDELEKGLLQMEQVTLKLMKPLQQKKQRAEAEKRYIELRSKLEAGAYDRALESQFRMTASTISKGKECEELLRSLQYKRERQIPFQDVYGLKPQIEGA